MRIKLLHEFYLVFCVVYMIAYIPIFNWEEEPKVMAYLHYNAHYVLID